MLKRVGAIDVAKTSGQVCVPRAAWLADRAISKPVVRDPRTLVIRANIVPAVTDHLGRFVGARPKGGSSSLPTALFWRPATATECEPTPKAAGRPDLHLHDLRHSGLTWAAATGRALPTSFAGAGAPTLGPPSGTSTRPRTEAGRSPAAAELSPAG